MVILAAQMLLWFASGLYMVVMDIDFIHGDHLLKTQNLPPIVNKSKIDFSEVVAKYPLAEQITLTYLAGQPVYQFIINDDNYLISAISGERLLPFSESIIREIASYYFAGNADVYSITYLDDTAPSELSKRHLPVWRVEFKDFASSTLYVSSTNGQVVTKRHNYWRIFDFVWMLHIMDYQTRSDVSNWLLRIFSILAILASLSGILLVSSRFNWFSWFRTRQKLKTSANRRGFS